MKPHIEEALLSLRLADRDTKAFEVLSDDPDVHLSVVCFHAQQAVEKSLKAALFAHEIEFGPPTISLSWRSCSAAVELLFRSQTANSER